MFENIHCLGTGRQQLFFTKMPWVKQKSLRLLLSHNKWHLHPLLALFHILYILFWERTASPSLLKNLFAAMVKQKLLPHPHLSIIWLGKFKMILSQLCSCDFNIENEAPKDPTITSSSETPLCVLNLDLPLSACSPAFFPPHLIPANTHQLTQFTPTQWLQHKV